MSEYLDETMAGKLQKAVRGVAPAADEGKAGVGQKRGRTNEGSNALVVSVRRAALLVCVTAVGVYWCALVCIGVKWYECVLVCASMFGESTPTQRNAFQRRRCRFVFELFWVGCSQGTSEQVGPQEWRR